MKKRAANGSRVSTNGCRETDFKNLGSSSTMSVEINRIEKEFVFKNLSESKSRIEIHEKGHTIGAFIKEVKKDRLILELEDSEDTSTLELDSMVNFFFRFRGKPMTFKAKIIGAEEGEIVIKQTAELFRDLSRGFERINNPENVEVSFFIKGQKIKLNYPSSELYDPVEEPAPANGFDPGRITDLMSSFREKAKAFAAENKIIMFRERKPQSFQEKVISRSGKILIAPFPADELNQREQFIRERVLTREELIRIETEGGTDLFRVLEMITEMEDELKKKGIRQELYCPILYHQYVVGYIYLVKNGAAAEPFKRKALDFVFQFSRVLSYSLKVNGYFKAEPIVEEFNKAELIDISGSGLLFGHPSEELDLMLYSDLDLTVRVVDREISAKGRVMRKYKDSGRTYIGVRFTQMDIKDMEYLFDHLYGGDYRGDIDAKGSITADDQEDFDF
jgi:hypothetical protein